MNGEGEEEIWCHFHPREAIIGICSSCLKERLLLLASSQRQRPRQRQPHFHLQTHHTPKKSQHPKIFALSSFIINPFDVMLHRSDNLDHHAVSDETAPPSSISHEDSFISIRFEGNGAPSWDKGKISKLPNDQNILGNADKNKSAVERVKPRATLRWRKRMAHMVHAVKWRRSARKGSGSNMGKKLDGSKVKNGWIRILAKRRAKE